MRERGEGAQTTLAGTRTRSRGRKEHLNGGDTPERRSGVTLTARGAIAVVLVITLAGHVLTGSAVLPSPALGMIFVAACLLAVFLVNSRELLSLVVTPPLIFFVATLSVETIRALSAASFAQALGVGMFATLSGGAPWLFVGSALVLTVAWRRGLGDNVRRLREDLREARATAPGTAAAAPGAPGVPHPRRDCGFDPEPEGYFEPRVYGTPRDSAD